MKKSVLIHLAVLICSCGALGPLWAVEATITSPPAGEIPAEFDFALEISDVPVEIAVIRAELAYRTELGEPWITAQTIVREGSFTSFPLTVGFKSWTGLLFEDLTGAFTIGVRVTLTDPDGVEFTGLSNPVDLQFLPDLSRSVTLPPDCTRFPACGVPGSACGCSSDGMEIERMWTPAMEELFGDPLACPPNAPQLTAFPKDEPDVQFISRPDTNHSIRSAYFETFPVDGRNVRQRVRQYAFWSEVHQRYVGYGVWLPEDHPGPVLCQDFKAGYPAVYFLHGSGGDETKEAELGAFLTDALGRGMEDTVYVFPNGGNKEWATASCDEPPCDCLTANWDTEVKTAGWSNGPRMAAKAALLELVEHIDANFCTFANRQNRGLEGMSDGGIAAFEIAFQNPHLFGSVQPLSGAYTSQLEAHDRGTPCTIVEDAAHFDQWMEQQTCRNVAFRSFVGGTDDFVPSNIDWARFLRNCAAPPNTCTDQLDLPQVDPDSFGPDPVNDDQYSLTIVPGVGHNWPDIYNRQIPGDPAASRLEMFDFHQDLFTRSHQETGDPCGPPPVCVP